MTRTLILLRHGKSDWRRPLADVDRPLKKRGRRESGLIGQWLSQARLRPDLILCSSAVRARQTIERVVDAAGCSPDIIEFHDSLYMAGVEQTLAVLAGAPDAGSCVLLVGHNPGLEDILVFLAGPIDVPDDGKRLPTATVAVLQTESDWHALERGSCRLSMTVRGRALGVRNPGW